MNTPQKNYNKSLFALATTAVLAAVSSTLCCIAPLVYLLFGISSTWLMGLSQYAFLQLPMLILSLGAFGYGFWLLIFSKKIICTKYLSRRGFILAYCVVLVLILFFLTYPYVLPYFLEWLE